MMTAALLFVISELVTLAVRFEFKLACACQPVLKTFWNTDKVVFTVAVVPALNVSIRSPCNPFGPGAFAN